MTAVPSYEELVQKNRKLQEELHKAKAEAEKASAAKSEILADMSQKIHISMNVIISMTELALQTELTEKQREYLNAVMTSADALRNLIKNFLDYSKIEAHRLELEGDRRQLDILLAEDNLVNQQLAVDLLESRGHRVACALNGEEAL